MNEYRLRQKHKKSNLEVEQWTVYSIADLMVATVIVVVAMCDAEPPRFRHFQRQAVQPSDAGAAPYPPSGYRPSGALFALPQREYGVPAQRYGPPQPTETETEQPQATTTELPETTTIGDEEVTTIEPQAENIQISNIKEQKRPVFIVVPRAQQQLKSQSYITYVQEYPEIQPEEIVYQQNAAVYSSKLQSLPLTSVYNPYAYFQIYQ